MLTQYYYCSFIEICPWLHLRMAIWFVDSDLPWLGTGKSPSRAQAEPQSGFPAQTLAGPYGSKARLAGL